MSDDIFESVSQGSNGAYDEENRRIQEVSDELQRLCRLYEEKPRDGKSYGGRFEIEQRIAEQYAKSNGLWIPMDRSQRAWHRVMLFSRCQFGILKVHQVIKRGLVIDFSKIDQVPGATAVMGTAPGYTEKHKDKKRRFLI